MKKLSVIIPSRNGLAILKEFLPVILQETVAAQGEVIVVDDCSDDNTSSEVLQLFPEVVLITRKSNPGFCHAVNLGMSRAHSNYVMLLNNDTIPSKDSFSKLVARLDQSEAKTAVVVPSIIRPDGSDDSSYKWTYKHGLAITGENIPGQKYPSGACALWKKNIWEKLGGLSSAYAPIYWEDTDLGVRMFESGYNMKICPDILVEHKHATTMGSSLKAETLRERNRFVFMDINCNSLSKKTARILWMPVHLLLALLKGNKAFINGYKEYLALRKNIK